MRTEGLGAVMRACGGGCGIIPPAQSWLLADRVASASRAAPGQQVLVNLDSIPPKDSLGRNAHVTAIQFRGNATFTLGAANEAVTEYQLRSLFQSMFLEDVSGWQMWAALDGRSLIDDAFFRHWRHLIAPQGAAQRAPSPNADRPYWQLNALDANEGAGDVSIPASLTVPLTDIGPGAAPLEGLIPLTALQRNGRDSLRFNVATAIAGAPADVTFNGFEQLDGRQTLDVWLKVVYLDGVVVVDSPTQVEEYELSDSSGALRRESRSTSYAVARFFPEDANGGQQLANDIDGVTVQAGGRTLCAGLSTEEMGARQELMMYSSGDSWLARNAPANSLPMRKLPEDTGTSELEAMVLIGNTRDRAASPSGPISFQFNSSPTTVRYLHRTVSCHTEQRAKDILRAAKCSPCGVSATNGRKVIDKGSPVGPIVFHEDKAKGLI